MEEEKIYRKLLLKLKGYIPDLSSNHKRLMQICAEVLDPAALNTGKFIDICDELERRGHLAPKNLEILKKVFVLDIRAYRFLIEEGKKINPELTDKTDATFNGPFTYRELLLQLDGRAPENSNNYERVKELAKLHLNPAELTGRVLDVFDNLYRKGHIEPENLKLLKEMFEEDKKALQDIEDTERTMRELSSNINPKYSGPAAYRELLLRLNEKAHKESNQSVMQLAAKSLSSDENIESVFDAFEKLSREGKLGPENMTILKEIFKNDEEAREDIETTKGKMIELIDQPSRVYEKSQGQKGFMVVLNWTMNRKGSDIDVKNVLSFFEDELKWYTETKMDLTELQLTDYIKELQSKLKMSAKEYYCFGITVMCHGNKDGLKVEPGKRFAIQTLIDAFKNDEIPTFVGKPRFFMIQACRGGAEQRVVELQDQASSTPEEIDDNVKLSLPVDSDIHVSYATTKGYEAKRWTGTVGSWFLCEALKEFKSNYKYHHMEDMLIAARYEVATKYRSICNPNVGQMPCCWSTFTKKLLFEMC